MHSQLLAFSRCMRSNGVSKFPDPTSNGKIPDQTPEPLAVSSSQYQAAAQACRHLLPNAGNGPSAAQVQKYRSDMLVYARCMRAHGISNFPDPDSQGRLDIGPGSSSGVDFNSPQFDAAFQVCHPIP